LNSEYRAQQTFKTLVPLYNSTSVPFYTLVALLNQSATVPQQTSHLTHRYFEIINSQREPYNINLFYAVVGPVPTSSNSLQIFNHYYDFRRSLFVEFFSEHSIDVPICFFGIRSLRRPNMQLPLLKFTNFLMRQGKREKFFIQLVSVFNLLFQHNKIKPNTNPLNLQNN
jgi:hypothetical protein